MKKNIAHAVSAASGLALAAALTLLTPSSHAQSTTATSTLVRTSSFEYDASGLLNKEIVEPDRPNDCLQTSYTHDSLGNRVSASTAACPGASGHALSSASTPRTSTTEYAAHSVTVEGTTYQSPAGAFPTRSTNALGQSETKHYDPRHGGVIRLTGPNGLVTNWAFDAFGRKTRETRADGTYTTWTYQLCQPSGQPRDPLCPASVGPHSVAWYASEASFDGTNAPLAPVKHQFHDALDRVVRVQTQDFTGQAIVQDTHYNALGQVNQKSILYALSGGNPHWTTYTYDRLGRLTTETAPDGNGGQATTQFTYSGLTTTVTNAQGQTQTTHKNASGQTAKVIDHLGNEVVYTHDALGQLTQTNAAGTVTRISYTQRGHKASMQDPAMGAWDYAYNAFGELVWQQDSLSQSSTITYDPLGRMTQRTEPDLVSRWYFDRNADNTACGAGIGKLCEATANNGYRRLHTYDTLGRPTRTATALDSATNLATVSQTYHPVTGRLVSQTWPTGYRANYTYTAQGFLSKVTGGGVSGHTQIASLEVLAIDPQGHITQYKQGNNVTTVKTHDQPTGKLHRVQATGQGQGAGNVLNHSYTYDKLGNLLTRNDANTGVAESFQYDALNRLSLYTVLGGGLSGAQSIQTLYDASGNLKYKSDVGYYHHDAQRPSRLNHITLAPEANWSAIGAVTQPNTGTRALSYAFDDTRTGARNITAANGAGTTTQPMGNGNLWYTVSQDQASGRHTVRWETYTSFNMPSEIRLGNLANPADPTATVAERTLNFTYGPEHQRIRQTVELTSNAPSHMEPGTTWYLNGQDSQGLSYEKEVKANGTTEHKHYLSAAGITFALYVQREGNLNGKPATSTRYFHHDHLGSIAAISDETGAVIERLAYDPWGKRRNANGTPDPLDEIYGVSTDRGYTMHEHLDEMGIVHMNGRIYDPLIGRFMSADPFIQAPGNLQSYNRYAYVLNNPLAYTDPSGYFFKKFFKTVVIRIVAAVADAMGCAGYCTMAVNAYQGYKSGGIAGLVASFIPGGDTLASQMAISAASGCVVASANGGNCGRGAGSALLEGGANRMGWGVAGAALGGCLASANQGGSCRHGAGNSFTGYAARHIAAGVSNEFKAHKRAEEYRASLVAGGPLLLIPLAPQASTLLAGFIARGLIFVATAESMRSLVGVLAVEGEGAGNEGEHVDLTGDRRGHILDGDKSGGGHGHGRNKPGKSEFPAGWSDDEAIDAISDVATDPKSDRQLGKWGRSVVRGHRRGQDIEVIVEPNGKIVTGYPNNVPRNPR